MAPVGEPLLFVFSFEYLKSTAGLHNTFSNFSILFSFLDPNSKEEENSLDTNPDEAYPLRCGVVRYNPLIQRCCYGRIILKSILCKPPRCGSQFYNPLSQKCCFGRPISKYARCVRPKCGRVYYNPLTQKCCYGRILIKYAVCRRG